MSSMRDKMPQTTRFIDWLREEFGSATVDAAIRDGMAGEPRFYAEENGHQLGTPATIEPSANCHTFTDRELDDMERAMIDWARAVRDGVVTDEEADALAGALHEVGPCVVIVDRGDLADDELEACGREFVWLEATGGVQ